MPSLLQVPLTVQPLRVVNQSAPSAPVVIRLGAVTSGPVGCRVKTPPVVIRPRAPSLPNQRAPSGPSVIAEGPLANSGGRTYSVTAPDVVIRPIFLACSSVNHRAPSGPAVMSVGPLRAVGTGYSVITAPVDAAGSWATPNPATTRTSRTLHDRGNALNRQRHE